MDGGDGKGGPQEEAGVEEAVAPLTNFPWPETRKGSSGRGESKVHKKCVELFLGTRGDANVERGVGRDGKRPQGFLFFFFVCFSPDQEEASSSSLREWPNDERWICLVAASVGTEIKQYLL